MNITDFFYSLLAIINEMSPYILLGFFIAGLLHVFVNQKAMSRHLSGHGWKPVVKAALFGIPLPLCSCGVLPAAVALRRQGASSGASTSFLIATPQTGVDSIAATYSLLGLPFAVIRPVAALVGAMAGGLAVGKWGNDNVEEQFIASGNTPESRDSRGFFSRLAAAVKYGFVDMVASVGKWLVFGLVIAALITVFVPDSFFLSLSRYPLLAMLAMVAVAVPMYICATGSIPVALSLMLKGLTPGVAFVLLMAGPAANFASVMILRRSHGVKATTIYVLSVVITAIAFGLLIDMLLPASWFIPTMTSVHGACHKEFGLFDTICSVILIGLLLYSAIASRTSHPHNIINNMEREYKIEGMACAHCKATVEKALNAVPGVESVEVDLGKGNAKVSGDVAPEKIIEAVRLAGFECC